MGKTISGNFRTMNPGTTRGLGITTIYVAMALLFIQLAAIMPDGARIWLPVYFFTLIVSYRHGWKMGMVMAIAAPAANYVLFGVPSLSILSGVMLKGALLCCAASFAAYSFGRVNLWIMLGIVVTYQLAGDLLLQVFQPENGAGWFETIHGWPGMALEVFGGTLALRLLELRR